MTVRELYLELNERIPAALSCAWDNDGLMCCPDGEREVKRVLVALDVTEEVAEMAIREGYDVILSHHPMIFRPLPALNGESYVATKAVKLLLAGVSVLSFHTRLDAVEGGVNDMLAARLGLQNVRPFEGSEGEMGRMGEVVRPISTEAFAEHVKQALNAPFVLVADSGRLVQTVAVMGGNGKDDLEAAKRAGADTYVSGRLSYNVMTDGPEYGMNLIEAGHYYTEQPVCHRLRELVLEAAPNVECCVIESINIGVI
ncbi:MAG: Nif3-like dinuclear metal center hexameric protein [Clostridia bacterium]|nr:Nif3-like dinuclear metal center hexameric protein [Clostridia bacterium]